LSYSYRLNYEYGDLLSKPFIYQLMHKIVALKEC
jgi:hypothetical protein